MVKGEKSMSLKDLRHILWGPVRVYEDATEKNDVVAYKEIGRASCRERVSYGVLISVGAGDR